MVGAFYNAFMPGTTGGDLVKAYYAAKHAPERRTRAVISVLVGLHVVVRGDPQQSATDDGEPLVGGK